MNTMRPDWRLVVSIAGPGWSQLEYRDEARGMVMGVYSTRRRDQRLYSFDGDSRVFDCEEDLVTSWLARSKCAICLGVGGTHAGQTAAMEEA